MMQLVLQRLEGVTELFYKDTLKYLKATIATGDVRREFGIVKRAIEMSYSDYLLKDIALVKHWHIVKAKKELNANGIRRFIKSLQINEALVLLALRLLVCQMGPHHKIHRFEVETKTLTMVKRSDILKVEKTVFKDIF